MPKCLFLLFMAILGTVGPFRLAVADEPVFPSYSFFELTPLIPFIEDYFPESKILQKTENIPAWKMSWDRARNLVQEHKYKEAIAQYTALLEKKSNLVEVRWELVLLLMKQEILQEAADNLDILLDEAPEQDEYLMLKAVLAQKNGRFEQSIELFNRIQNPLLANQSVVLAGLANAYAATGEKLKSFEAMGELLKSRQDDNQLVLNYAIMAYEIKEYAVSRDYIVKLADQKGASPQVLMMAAKIYSLIGLRQEAKSYWLRFITFYPENVEAHENLADYYEERGGYEEAIEHLAILYKIRPKEDYLKRVGQAYMELREFGKALFYFDKYMARNRNDKAVVRDTIKIYAALGDKAKTLKALKHYFNIESRPEKSSLQKAAELYDEKGYYDEAIPIYQKLLELTPDDPAILWSLAQNFLAVGQAENSLKVWQQLARVSPGVLEVYRPMAALLERLGHKEEFAKVLRVIDDLDPEDDEVKFKLARLYFEGGDFKQCQELLSRLRGEFRKRPEFYLWRGTISARNASYLEAATDFKKVLSVMPGREDLRWQLLKVSAIIGDLETISGQLKYWLDHDRQFTTAEQILLVEVFLNCGDFEGARQRYGKIINDFIAEREFSPNGGNGDFQKLAYVAVRLAESLNSAGLVYESEQVLRQAFFLTEDDPAVLAGLLSMAINDGRLADARQWFNLLGQHLRPGLKELMALELLVAEGSKWSAKKDVRKLSVNLLKLDILQEVSDPNWYQVNSSGEESLAEAFKLAEVYVSLGDFDVATDICRKILSAAPNFIEAEVLLEDIRQKTAGGSGAKLNSELSGFSLAYLRYYGRLFRKYRMYEQLEKVAIVILQKAPGSLWGQEFLAEAKANKGNRDQAVFVYEDILKEYPAVLGVSVELAALYFEVGKIIEAISICESLQSLKRGDLIEMLSRLYWMNYEWDKSIDLYERQFSPSVDEGLKSIASRFDVLLPEISDDRKVWEIISMVPEKTNKIAAVVMRPGFGSENDPFRLRGFSLAAAGLYADYRWQDKFVRELGARKSVKRQEYFLAAKKYERLLESYPEEYSLYYDLAGVYGRLGRISEEAGIYEILTERKIDFPGMIKANERIRLKQRPYLQATYGFDSEEGRNSYKNIEKQWQGLDVWYSPEALSEWKVGVSRINYKSVSGDGVLRANQAEILYKTELFYGLSAAMQAGVHDLQSEGAENFIFDFSLLGKLGDKLTGTASFSREIVADTIASLSRSIINQSFDTGISLDLHPRLTIGGDYSYADFSDNNWTTGYDLWSSYIIFSEPYFLQLKYRYDFKESEEWGGAGLLIADGFAVDDHPYWAPKNYWTDSFGLYFKHILAGEPLGPGAPHYYEAEYFFGHDSTGYAFQEFNGAYFFEVSPAIFFQASAGLTSSQPFREKKFLLSASYRW